MITLWEHQRCFLCPPYPLHFTELFSTFHSHLTPGDSIRMTEMHVYHQKVMYSSDEPCNISCPQANNFPLHPQLTPDHGASLRMTVNAPRVQNTYEGASMCVIVKAVVYFVFCTKVFHTFSMSGIILIFCRVFRCSIVVLLYFAGIYTCHSDAFRVR